jgi:hypothetical protein
LRRGNAQLDLLFVEADGDLGVDTVSRPDWIPDADWVMDGVGAAAGLLSAWGKK